MELRAKTKWFFDPLIEEKINLLSGKENVYEKKKEDWWWLAEPFGFIIIMIIIKSIKTIIIT